MNVLILSSTQDTGGQGVRIKQAFDCHTDWTVRSMAPATWIRYPADLPWRKRVAEELYQQADVIHVRNDFSEYDRMAAKFGAKPVVIHYHGTKFRGDPNRYLRQQRERNAIGIVSTLDLWLLGPDDLVWLPAAYNVDALAEIRHAQRPVAESRV